MIKSDRRLRFCIVSTFYPPYNFGGDGIYAQQLANALARLGHDVTVLHSPSAYEVLSRQRVTAPYADHPNVRVRGIRTPLGVLGLLAVHQTGFPCLQGPALRRWLHHGEFDVIHYNNVSLLGGPRVFHYGTGLKLATLHDYWMVCPMHVLWKLNREACSQPSCLRCTLAGRRPPQWWRYSAMMQRANKQIDLFIGLSDFSIRLHQERGFTGPMVHLPIFSAEPPVAMEPPAWSHERHPFFLFVGRLEKLKGVQTILPVFRALPEVNLLIAGSGNYESTLRAMVAGAPNIRFLGQVAHVHQRPLYQAAVATIVPSLCYEGFPLVAAESFAAGTPLVVPAHGALQEIVNTYGGGLLYRTPEELRQTIEGLLRDTTLRQRLGHEGFQAYQATMAETPFLRRYLTMVYALLAYKRTAHALTEAQHPSRITIPSR